MRDHKLKALYEMLDALGVAVEFCDLPADLDGEYDHENRVIRIQHDLRTRRYRSTLGHETCHAVYGDTPSRFGPVNAKQERRADEWAALRLIDLADYRHEEDRTSGHVEAMAIALNVTTDLVLAFRAVLLRVGGTVYVEPKMGAGRFSHRIEVA